MKTNSKDKKRPYSERGQKGHEKEAGEMTKVYDIEKKVFGTPLQLRAYREYLKVIKNEKGAAKTYAELLEKAGYSSKTKPYHVFKTNLFQQVIKTLPDQEIAFKWFQWALDDDPANRGHALRAGENVMKLKQRFPDKKVQVSGVESKLKDIIEIDYEEDGEE